MTKLNLENVAGGFNLSAINRNFDRIEDVVNDSLLSRADSEGEPNSMEVDLDMDNNHIYNLPEPVLEHEPVRLQDLLEQVAGGDYQRNLRVTDRSIPAFPNAAQRASKLMSFDAAGNPQVQFPSADSATQLRIDLSNPLLGANLISYSPSVTVKEQLDYLLKDWVSVQNINYNGGAKGDGVTDDTAAIKAAIATGKSVLFPDPDVFYRITEEIGPKFPGQILYSVGMKRGGIRNTTTSAYLARFGGVDGPCPQAGIVGLRFFGNSSSLGGIRLDSANTSGVVGWTDANKDCILRDCGVDFVGSGWGLEIYTWSNQITNFTIYEGCQKGAIYDVEHNQNTTEGLYITGCSGVSLQVGGNGTTRGRANYFSGVVVQQSGGAEGVVVIADSDGTTINGLYSESNNSKGAPYVVNIKSSAAGTTIAGMTHLSGGSIVIDNSGIGTIVDSVTSSNIAAGIFRNSAGSAAVRNLNFFAGVTPTGVKFIDSVGTALHQDSDKFNKMIVSSFAPVIEFQDQSAGVSRVRQHVDQGVYRLQNDPANDGSFSRTALQISMSGNDAVIDSTFRPLTDNNRSLGAPTNRWQTVYAGTGTINTSDENEKTEIQDIPDNVLRAWEKVRIKQFKFKDSISLKGNSARVHYGLIAQQVKEAFESEGLDAFSYGVLCCDEWIDDAGKEQKRYGIRYDEACALSLALLQKKISLLENKE